MKQVFAGPVNVAKTGLEETNCAWIDPVRGVCYQLTCLVRAQSKNVWVSQGLRPDQVVMQRIVFPDNALKTDDITDM